MIAYLKGEIAEILEDGLILECGPVGYRIYMPGSHLDQNIYVGREVKIHTYFHVREDAMQLYGFLTRDDLKTFELLLGVNGIGPKAALGILSGLTADELRFAILAEDVKTISKAPGVGAKTAKKLILELKDKMNLREAFELKSAHMEEIAESGGEGNMQDAKKEAVQALVALGYSNTDALRAVRDVQMKPDMDVEDILKQSLKKMSFL